MVIVIELMLYSKAVLILGGVRIRNRSLRTDSTSTTLVPINMEHFHDSEEKKLGRQQLRVQVKRKATNDLTSRPSKIISELHKFADQ